MRLRPKNKEAGFTIVEMAVVLIVFGFIASIVLAALKYAVGREVYGQTQITMDRNNSAMLAFAANYFRYPCPANPTAAPGDADYGREDCSGASLIEVDGRAINGVPQKVWVGTIPFQTLLDPNNDGDENDKIFDEYIAKYGLDSWGNKITYAVTASMVTGIDQNAGAIFIENEKHKNLLEAEGTAHYVLISHGENGRGAYGQNGGNPAIDCTNGVVTPPTNPPSDAYETQNCDFNLDAVFLNGLRNDSTDKPYDDFIRYSAGNVTSLWKFTGAKVFDNGTIDPTDDFPIFQVSAQNGGDVGIGLKSPQEKLHVSGNVMAEQVRANSICPENGDSTLCMPIDVIAGELPDMQCSGAGQVVTAIEENQVRCSSAFSSMPAGTCPAGTVMKGLSSKTGVICQ